MNYFIKEEFFFQGRTMKSAASKARLDIENIFLKNDFQPIIIKIIPRKGNMDHISTNLINHYQVMKLWQKATNNLKKGDLLYIQFPFLQHSVFLRNLVKELNKKGIKLVAIIHDIESIRVVKRKDISKLKSFILLNEENAIFKWSTKLIVHNDRMKDFLRKKGVSANKLLSLGIFDYLIPKYDEQRMALRKIDLTKPIIIAGTLRPHKAGYIYQLPMSLRFNLYGVGYIKNRQQKNICYKGVFQPDELPYHLEGSFGLVWDGNSPETCAGVYGDYLRINSPHKLSLYLAAGVPVIVWEKSAMADFVVKSRCGFTINSLFEINVAIKNTNLKKYNFYKKNAQKIGVSMLKGCYTKKSIVQVH